MNKNERLQMVKAMEYITRQINDENVFMRWLLCGVADGDIPYGDVAVKPEDLEDLDYYIDDESLADLMGVFLRCMSGAAKSGGLWCDGVLDARTREKDRMTPDAQ